MPVEVNELSAPRNPPALLTRWRKRFNELDDCPWPGPRPLDQHRHAGHLLVGRDEDRRNFRQEVDQHRLVLLSGPSGVGKTSLLQRGLVPDLESDEIPYLVAVCDEWGGNVQGGLNPATYLAAKIHDALADRVPDLPQGPKLFKALHDRFGERAVIVLDQFEELIRYAPAAARLVYELLLQINRQMNLKVVVSFRSEYLHELRPLETGARPFTYSRYILDEIDPSFALDVVLAANGDGRSVVTDQAARALAEAWAEARKPTQQAGGTDPFGRVGLLHLQAALYAMHRLADGGVVEEKHLAQLRNGADDVELFKSGLRQSIETKLERCRTASYDLGLDRFLVEGTAQLVASSVRHLSSAGYKLVREAGDLAALALDDALESLIDTGLPAAGAKEEGGAGDGRLRDGQLDALLTTLVDAALDLDIRADEIDLLDVTRGEIAAAADAKFADPTAVGWTARLHDGLPPWLADPRQVSCGPMFGLAPGAILLEEMRRFAFALAWMTESSIVRVTSPGGAATVVSLIHDGFGTALREWSRTARLGPAGALHAVTAPRGASYPWALEGDRPWDALIGAPGEPKVLANLRWRGIWVRADFRHVVFANCDLRGTMFDECTFDGVMFLNCQLDGAMFSKCEFIGTHAPSTGSWDTREPVFRLAADASDLVADIARYRETPTAGGTALFSPLPGLPAVGLEAERPDLMVAAAPEHGVVICGGRLSSLVLRSCTFPDATDDVAGHNATSRPGLSFRHVAGASLEVVEFEGTCRYEIFGSAMRQITVTTPADRGGAQVDLDLRGSLLAQLWLGDDLRGTVDADNCVLLQVWNGSTSLTFVARGCPYFGVVNVKLDESCPELTAVQAATLQSHSVPDAAFVQDMTRMDYRRDPALVAHNLLGRN